MVLVEIQSSVIWDKLLIKFIYCFRNYFGTIVVRNIKIDYFTAVTITSDEVWINLLDATMNFHFSMMKLKMQKISSR